jgi:hypothetical protein
MIERIRNLVQLTDDIATMGACGDILSVYFRDPDGSLLELSNYMN